VQSVLSDDVAQLLRPSLISSNSALESAWVANRNLKALLVFSNLHSLFEGDSKTKLLAPKLRFYASFLASEAAPSSSTLQQITGELTSSAGLLSHPQPAFASEKVKLKPQNPQIVEAKQGIAKIVELS
jgi:hypothetical protein